jgi:AcrR family transcriptional regulator
VNGRSQARAATKPSPTRLEAKAGAKRADAKDVAKRADAKDVAKRADANDVAKRADAKDGAKRADAKDGAKRADAKDGAKRAKTEMYRRLILEAAEQVLSERGYDEAKIQEIAQHAGIALGTLYSVFPGKTEIYGAIQEQRGQEILERIQRAIHGHEGVVDACKRGIDAYVRALAERPAFLRMHLREGLSWTSRSSLRSGEEVATWERGMALAITLLQAGIDRGYLHAESRPELVLKMIVATHQVQLQDWLERGGKAEEIEPLIARMQHHFVRAFVRAAEPFAASGSDTKSEPREPHSFEREERASTRA